MIKHERSQGLIDYAIQLATEWHEGQVRKYTFEPYITHPLAVATKVAQYTDDCQIICGAILHDVVEDCGVSKDTLVETFGFGIAEYVMEVTNDKDPAKNRSLRKFEECEKMASSSIGAKIIRLADIIHNCDSIIKEDPDFAKVYIREKLALLPLMKIGTPEALYNECRELLLTHS